MMQSRIGTKGNDMRLVSSATDIGSVICFSPDEWGDVRRPQQLMRCFASRVPVLFVEPPLSIASVLKRGTASLSPQAKRRIRRALLGSVEQVEPGIHVVTPLAVVPEYRLSGVAPTSLLDASVRATTRSIGRRVRRAARSLGLVSSALWFAHPMPIPDVLLDEAQVLVYDCVDLWADFPGPLSDPWWRGRIMADERRLIDDSDVVFCSAEGLLASRGKDAAGRANLLRNAADVEHFLSAGRPMPEDLRELPGPLVGFVGAVAGWVDLELLRAVALKRPEWSFVMVGSVFEGSLGADAAGIDAVRDVANVHFLGFRNYEDLPAYFEAFDAAIIPFKLSALTDDMNPIKLYEYLAAGLPVVSTPTREVEVLGLGEVGVASEPDDFVAELERAFATRWDPELQDRRVALARANSWDARVDAAWPNLVSRPRVSRLAGPEPAPRMVAEEERLA